MPITIDPRPHVLGDLLMITGTIDPRDNTGLSGSISYDGLLGTVLAAGGHLLSTFSTGVVVDGNFTAGANSITVKTTDARTIFNNQEDVYFEDSGVLKRLGTIGTNGLTNLGATTIPFTGKLLHDVSDNTVLRKFGPNTGAITLKSGDFTVNVDETNKRVVFSHGSDSATNTNLKNVGRFFILGSRA
tara:strand:- start:759 stop:1319 length:561 start_codon:yes stop_codon:yes gene_type:complete